MFCTCVHASAHAHAHVRPQAAAPRPWHPLRDHSSFITRSPHDLTPSGPLSHLLVLDEVVGPNRTTHSGGWASSCHQAIRCGWASSSNQVWLGLIRPSASAITADSGGCTSSSQMARPRLQTLGINWELKSSQVKPSQVKPRRVKPSQVKPRRVKPSQVKPRRVKPSQVKSSRVGRVESCRVESSQVKSSQGKSSQAKSSQVKLRRVKQSQSEAKARQVKSSHPTRPLACNAIAALGLLGAWVRWKSKSRYSGPNKPLFL